MRILLFGGSGQLGYEIRSRSQDLNFELISPVMSEVDIGDANQPIYLAKQLKPDVIINSAAYTAVDQAESEPEEAFRINRDGARNAARAAAEVNGRLIHISTDYVYGGDAAAPIKEGSPVNPLSVYGRSKLEGDEAVLEVMGDNALILRTSSLHGQRGVNFVHTMIKLFEEREHVSVVGDQYMSPTYAGWLSEVILDLSRMTIGGLMHASCSGVISWFDFAKKIHELAEIGGRAPIRAKLSPTTMSEFKRPAKRPRYSALDCSKLEAVLGRKTMPWELGVRIHMREIGYKIDG